MRRASGEEAFTRAAIEQRIEPMLAQYPALVQEQIAGVPSRRPNGTISSDRARVEYLLAYLGALRDPQGQPIDDSVLDMIVALLERAEVAERAVKAKETKAERAEQRAQAAEHRAETAERQLQAAPKSANAQPRSTPKQRPAPAPIYEYRDEAGICRVCARKAPPQSAARQDDLRVCRAESCRQEARRRDNNAKQRRYKERRLAQGMQSDMIGTLLKA